MRHLRRRPGEQRRQCSQHVLCAAPGWGGGTGKRGRSGGMAVSSSAEPDHHHQLMDVVAAAAPKAVVEQTVPLAFAVAAPPSNLPASSVPNASVARTTNLSGESSSAQSVHDDAMETVVALALAGAASPPAEAAIHQQQQPLAARAAAAVSPCRGPAEPGRVHVPEVRHVVRDAPGAGRPQRWSQAQGEGAARRPGRPPPRQAGAGARVQRLRRGVRHGGAARRTQAEALGRRPDRAQEEEEAARCRRRRPRSAPPSTARGSHVRGGAHPHAGAGGASSGAGAGGAEDPTACG